MLKHTFKNGDSIEMKAVQHCNFASEETHCYQANLYFNGKLMCEVSNDGKGASDRQYPTYPFTRKDIDALDNRCKAELPKWVMMDGEQYETCLEMWCGEQVNKYLSAKDMDRLMKTKILFVEPDNTISVIGFKNTKKIDARHIEHAKLKYPNLPILNTMPKERALKIFMELS